MKAPNIRIVVADASRARFFERHGAKGKLIELMDLAMVAPDVEVPRDRPPRVHDRMGAGRHAIEPRVTPREAAQERFLTNVAEAINKAAAGEAFDRLMLCAPPRALGLLRDQLSIAAKAKVSAAFHKDFIHDPVDTLQAHLDAAAP